MVCVCVCVCARARARVRVCPSRCVFGRGGRGRNKIEKERRKEGRLREKLEEATGEQVDWRH